MLSKCSHGSTPGIDLLSLEVTATSHVRVLGGFLHRLKSLPMNLKQHMSEIYWPDAARDWGFYLIHVAIVSVLVGTILPSINFVIIYAAILTTFCLSRFAYTRIKRKRNMSTNSNIIG